MDGHEYILFYVPVTVECEIVWETPLNRLYPRHEIRLDMGFRREVQRIIIFAEIMALTSMTESSIWIRNGVDDTYIPVAINENNTTINRSMGHDFSIVSKTLINKWFGEDIDFRDVVKEMIYFEEYPEGTNLLHDNRAEILMQLRTRIEEIINKYDNTLIWYTYFIIDRIARHL